MLETTAGQLAVNEALPPDLRDYNRVLDGSGVTKLFQQLGEAYRDDPDVYRDVSKALSDIGRETAYRTGGFSFGLQHLRQSPATKRRLQEIEQQTQQILKGAGDSGEKQQKILQLLTDARDPLEKMVYDDAIHTNNPLSTQVLSRIRGNKTNLRSLLGADLLYIDQKNQPIPVPVLKSYSQGLSPAEYWAGAYGARKGVTDVKLGTAKAGYFGKLLTQSSHRLIVTGDDDPEDDGTSIRGLPTDTSDGGNVGALLAIPMGGYKRNTVITPRILKDLQNQNIDKILVRSPTVGGPADGGVYARDVGVREKSGLPPRADFVGVAAAQALAEKIAQGALCLAAGTLVRMADWTVKAIEDIVIGDMVMGADKNGIISPVRVTAVFDNGLRECVRTEFAVAQTRERLELISTGDHKLLATTRYWAPTTEIAEHGVFPVNTKCVKYAAWMPKQVINTRGNPEPYALLLGLLLGDGCYTKSVHGVHLSCFDPTLVTDVEPYLDTLGLRIKLLSGQKGYYRISQVKDTVNQCVTTGRMLPGDRNPILRKLKELGMYGKYAHEKQLPDTWQWDQESVAELLSGLFVTDGSVYRGAAGNMPYIGYGSTSLHMIEQIREILKIRFGIWASPIHGNSSSRKRLLYSFVISRANDVETFLREIPLRGIKKTHAARLMTERQRKLKVDMRLFRKKSQKSVGELQTYDISVANEDHLFVLANGLIVSNSSKHSGGVAGSSANAAVSGFDHLNQLVSIPQTFKGGATHAEVDGTISLVEEAPQGGSFVTVAGTKHYIPHGFQMTRQVGDEIEAGDTLSDGIPNPAKIVQYKGIGEGRRYFVKAFKEAMDGAGVNSERRNIELVARGLIDHVRLTAELGDFSPDDVVPYRAIENNWEPREDSALTSLSSSVGHYLEKPILHYSIGTKIKKSMLPDLQRFGVGQLLTNREPPPFVPEMITAKANMSHDTDWMTRFLGSGHKDSLLKSVHRGLESDPDGTSYVPAIASGVDFGLMGKTAPVPSSPTSSLLDSSKLK